MSVISPENHPDLEPNSRASLPSLPRRLTPEATLVLIKTLDRALDDPATQKIARRVALTAENYFPSVGLKVRQWAFESLLEEKRMQELNKEHQWGHPTLARHGLEYGVTVLSRVLSFLPVNYGLDSLKNIAEAVLKKEIISGNHLDSWEVAIKWISGLIPAPAFIIEPTLKIGRKILNRAAPRNLTLETVEEMFKHFKNWRDVAAFVGMINADSLAINKVEWFLLAEREMLMLKRERQGRRWGDSLKTKGLEWMLAPRKYPPENLKKFICSEKILSFLGLSVISVYTAYDLGLTAANIPDQFHLLVNNLQQGNIFQEGIYYLANAFGPLFGQINWSVFDAATGAGELAGAFVIARDKNPWPRFSLIKFFMPRFGGEMYRQGEKLNAFLGQLERAGKRLEFIKNKGNQVLEKFKRK